jgi:regulatory protein
MKRERPPLDAAKLDELALGYVGRFATTRAKLRRYLERKLFERGWSGGDPPPVERIVERLADSGFVDDAGFADGRGAALTRRGYGVRRVAAALRDAGIDEASGADAIASAHEAEWESALAFARRRRIGPFAAAEADRKGRERAVAALLRAGHPMALARRIASAAPGRVPERDG